LAAEFPDLEAMTTMSTSLLPQAFWFRLAVTCPRIDGFPRKANGRLLALPDDCRLMETSRLDGKTPWAEVRVAWNLQGLAVAVEAEATPDAVGADDQPELFNGLRVWVDTRDTRDVSRATRFCHRVDARLTRGGGKNGLGVVVQQRPIARAVADAPMSRLDASTARAERLKKGWRLELFLPSSALNGFDPETNRRLGFTYQVTAHDREDQFLGVGREFPIGENPSLWSTLELKDAE
jgi:hypothetical protein